LRSGSATDISVGKDGVVWVTGVESVGGGHPVFRYQGNDNWLKLSGGGVRIAAIDNFGVILVNSEGRFFNSKHT